MTKYDQTADQRDTITQSIISLALGLSAFLAFCILRPRWTGLYAARKRQKDAASRLPELPDTFLGWIPTLYRISEKEVLASAGLDAFVFLAFFRMAIKFLTVTLFFSLVIILPVHAHYLGDYGTGHRNNSTTTEYYEPQSNVYRQHVVSLDLRDIVTKAGKKAVPSIPQNVLWMYVALVYLFSALAMYLIISETKRIISIRQEFLGSQTTITDRTIRLSGIPSELRSEEKIKETIESLEIGKVESVMLCKNWKELDDLLGHRMNILRKLEEAWTVHLGSKREDRARVSLQGSDRDNDNDEQSRLLNGDGNGLESDHGTAFAHDRPVTRIWYGFMHLQSRRIDAIDYYEETLRNLDEKIKSTREKEFSPTPLAFVTLDSVAASQMAVQAIMDPEPMQLVANLAPAPSDVIWQNTYLSRKNRMIRAWSITLIIAFLTVFWSLLLIPLAGLLNLDSIGKVWPGLAKALEQHDISRTLIQTGLPTLLISLLNVAVPYIYYWLSSLQGMISQGDVELSVISKNFFFTFFNLFIVFTIFGTASNAYGFFNRIGDSLKDTTSIAHVLATSLQGLAPFYINLIVLQGIGLFPFRLLEFGSVALYPVSLMGAKTPRDYAELVQPPVFSYGFYLPQTILIFIICIVYSVLPSSWQILLFGLIYFVIGSFTYKYQLLYAMDHRQHSTGKAWAIICNRIVLGLGVFQIAMAGVLALQSAITPPVLIVPLLAGTVWFSYFFRRTYEPLMEYIALRSLQSGDFSSTLPRGESRYDSETSRGRDVDEDERTGLRFINPSLIIPLEDVWLARKRVNDSNHVVATESQDNLLSVDLTAFKTSSEILLSRGVASSDSEFTATTFSAAAPLISVFQNESVCIIALGPPARSTVIRYACSPSPSPFIPISISSEATSPANPNTVQRLGETPLLLPIDMPVVPAMTKRLWPVEGVVTGQSTSPISSGRGIQVFPASTPPSIESSPESSVPSTPSSGHESPVRGRTLTIIGTQHGLVSRATSRRQAGPSSIEFDGGKVQYRLISRNFSAEPQNLDASLIEPYPVGSSVSTDFSELMTRSFVDVNGFSGHRDTFALWKKRRPKNQYEKLPRSFFYRLRRYIDFETYLAIRLSCRCWSVAITRVHPLTLPPVFFLPTEIVEQIYRYLSPTDFNAARHTCRAWMMASLESQLLTLMLRRGGWWAAAQVDVNADNDPVMERTNNNEEWLMSKRIATECSLRPGWTGNGLGRFSPGLSSFSLNIFNALPRSEPIGRSSLALTSQTDFSELSSDYSTADYPPNTSALHFNVSVCGKFVLVIEGCVIYIYRLRDDAAKSTHHGGQLEPLTSIICPLRVLVASMDTSSQRFAIAALIDGRMGLVCDLHEIANTIRPLDSQTRARAWGMSDYRSCVTSSRNSGDRAVTEQALPEVYGARQDRSWSTGGTGADDLHNRRGNFRDPIGPTIVSAEPGESRPRGIPIETGSRSIYRNLCSEDDPPRSVAICPQRRCVAFGCGAGIELHWVDALTGTDLNRWFPLTAPSDFLYFLPPRPGVDTAKKLRLISSAAHPKEIPSLTHRFFPTRTVGPPFWEDLGGSEGGRRRENCDHYRAVPLSDGFHVLFTDPATGLLFLGSDAPLGGTTKLDRRIMFLGPEGCLPRVYAAAAELRWGVRIAAGYGDMLWLFCVPPDIFHGKEDDEWPVTISGVEIGMIQGLIDVAIEGEGGGVTIWAFGEEGMGYAWRINGGSGDRARKRVVRRDGVVVDEEDLDGDVVMTDACEPRLHDRTIDFDGPATELVRRPGGIEADVSAMRQMTEHDWFDMDVRDVEMRDVLDDEDEGYASDEIKFAIHTPAFTERWSEAEEEADWVPDFLGDGDRGDQGVDVWGAGRLECGVFGCGKRQG